MSTADLIRTSATSLARRAAELLTEGIEVNDGQIAGATIDLVLRTLQDARGELYRAEKIEQGA